MAGRLAGVRSCQVACACKRLHDGRYRGNTEPLVRMSGVRDIDTLLTGIVPGWACSQKGQELQPTPGGSQHDWLSTAGSRCHE